MCAELAAKPDRLSPDDQTHEAMQTLGDDYLAMFFCNQAGATEFARSIDESGIPEQLWERGTSHRPLMANMYESKIDLLAQLQQPAVLLHGRPISSHHRR